MKKAILTSLCFTVITAAVFSTEVERPHHGDISPHKSHIETRATGKETLPQEPVSHNKQVVEKEIAQYIKLLKGAEHDTSPVGISLKAHYENYITKLKELHAKADTIPNIDAQLYKLHQSMSPFSKFY